MSEKAIIVGGTFGFMHKGHRALLGKAFRIGDSVYIGLTTDAYVKRKRHGGLIPKYAARKRALERFARSFGKPFGIKPLEDRFGPSTTGDFYAMVVSKETKPTALEINRIRKGSGLRPLRIAQVRRVLAEDGMPISTLRIIRREIDGEGRRVTAPDKHRRRAKERRPRNRQKE